MRGALVGALAALVVGLAAFLATSQRLPDLEVRTIPWRTPAGGAQAAAPPGETFVAARDGLRRIDLAVTPLEPASAVDLELVLRDGGPEGEVLRRVTGSGFEPFQWGGWLRFDLEPLPDSAGRRLHLALLPAHAAPASHVAPYVRYRGVAGRGRWEGEAVLDGPLVEGELLSEQPDLRALAFFLPRLEGTLTLTLLDAETGRELRRASSTPPAPVTWGWVPLGFEPIAESRWKRYGYRLELPAGAELRAGDEGPSFFPFHGSGEVDGRLVGMTLGGALLDDRDLVFRAWSRSGPGTAAALLAERLGWRLAPLVLLWLTASALLGAALTRPRA